MDSRISQRFWRILASLALVSMSAAAIAAQDPDPNSPTPILLSEAESTRALAQPQGNVRGTRDLAKSTSPAFLPDDKVELFVTNLELLEGEGANAFRVYGIDKAKHQFRFPVLALEPIEGTDVFRVTINLRDEIGFWDMPAADGDIMIYLTWRGLSSNRVRLGLGQIGGNVKDDASSRPTPFGTKGDRQRVDAPNYIGYRWSGDSSRLGQQATFGSNLAFDNKVRRLGIRAWLNEQFAAQYPSPSFPYPSNALQPANQQANCDGNEVPTPELYPTCQRDTYTMYQPQTWFFKQAFYGDAQLKHRVAWSLGQIWVTSGNDIQQGRHMVEWHKILSKHAFGNYRDLMKEMTLHPTMGEYLNMNQSTRTSPNENYARELMQLFAVGLFNLNQDGTLQRDAQNNPIPTYSQDGVNDLTRVLTGWRMCDIQNVACPNAAGGLINYIDPMLFNRSVTTINGNLHDVNSKVLLTYPGVNPTTRDIPACGAGCAAPTAAATALANIKTYAEASLDKAIDNIYNHPNVGPFVGKILIQHLVTSDPTPAYVSRVAAVFNANRTNPNQMREVVRAILLDPEARGDIKTDPNFGKLREPVQFFTNFARAFNIRGANGTGQTDGNFSGGRACGRNEFNAMAQVPFMAPTVFNFFPPDYGIPGTTLLGPEFAIMTTGTAIARATFVNRLTFGGTTPPATTPTAAYSVPFPVSNPPTDCPTGASFDFSDLVALSTADATGGQLVDELNRKMLHGSMSPTMRTSIMGALPAYAGNTALTHESRVRQALYLVATSSQYQVQR